MNIRDLNLDDYVIVYDIGKSENSEGMAVVGRVDEIIFNEDDKNEAGIDSLGNFHHFDDSNYFDLWSNYIESKTESVSDNSIPKAGQEFYFDAKDLGPHNFIKINNQSNDLQQRKRNDTVNHPSHYNYGDIEVIDYCDQVCKQYPPELAPYVFNAIKYLSRANHKNGREDIDKAKFYVQRLFDKWDVK